MSSVNQISWNGAYPPEKTAYVLIHHGESSEHFVGIKMTIRSIQYSKSTRPIVVLVPPNTDQDEIAEIEGMGARVKVLPEVERFALQVTGQQKKLSRPLCEHSFKVLLLWSLTEYERVIYLHTSSLIILNLDELFLCGHMCMVYMNWVHFSASLLVVKPDFDQFRRLSERYLRLPFLQEGARQEPEWCDDEGWKFLLDAFFNMEAAPLFLPANGQQEAPKMRLSLFYNVNAILWYEHFSWNLLKSPQYQNLSIPAHAVAFYGLKPYAWTQAIFFDLHWIWQAWRKFFLHESHHLFLLSRFVLTVCILAATLVGVPRVFTSLYGSRPFWRKKAHAFGRQALDRLGADILMVVWGLPCTLFVGLALARHWVPLTAPPELGWPVFVSLHVSLLLLTLKITSCAFNPMEVRKKRRTASVSGNGSGGAGAGAGAAEVLVLGTGEKPTIGSASSASASASASSSSSSSSSSLSGSTSSSASAAAAEDSSSLTVTWRLASAPFLVELSTFFILQLNVYPIFPIKIVMAVFGVFASGLSHVLAFRKLFAAMSAHYAAQQQATIASAAAARRA